MDQKLWWILYAAFFFPVGFFSLFPSFVLYSIPLWSYPLKA